MRATRHLYDVPGWGIGEVWVRDGTIVQHELASEALRHEQERATEIVPITAADPVDAIIAGPAAPDPSTLSPNGGSRLPARTLPDKLAQNCDRFVPDLCQRIALHLAGVPTSYEGVPIDLEWATPLQRDLVTAARAIPWGEVLSYGELAALAGRPRAARAAGTFCAENRFSLIIPCHRVVAADGIGGYGSAGPELKRRLLELEGVLL